MGSETTRAPERLIYASKPMPGNYISGEWAAWIENELKMRTGALDAANMHIRKLDEARDAALNGWRTETAQLRNRLDAEGVAWKERVEELVGKLEAVGKLVAIRGEANDRLAQRVYGEMRSKIEQACAIEQAATDRELFDPATREFYTSRLEAAIERAEDVASKLAADDPDVRGLREFTAAIRKEAIPPHEARFGSERATELDVAQKRAEEFKRMFELERRERRALEDRVHAFCAFRSEALTWIVNVGLAIVPGPLRSSALAFATKHGKAAENEDVIPF